MRKKDLKTEIIKLKKRISYLEDNYRELIDKLEELGEKK